MKIGIDQVISRELYKTTRDTNLVYLPYNGYFEWMLSSIPAKLLSIVNKDSVVYEWPCDSWPKNLSWVQHGMAGIPNRLEISGVLGNWKKDHPTIGNKLANSLHVPFILAEHDLPSNETRENLRQYVNSKMPKNTHYVIPNDILIDQWKYPDSFNITKIPYGFPVIKDDKSKPLLVVGNYNKQDEYIIKEMLESCPDSIGLGFNSCTTPYKSIQEIYEQMSTCAVCVTATGENVPPFLAMMAAGCGCAIVTNKTRWTDAIFTEGETALFFDSPFKIKTVVKELLKSQDKIDKMGEAARNLIEKEYSVDGFINGWSDFLRTTISKVFIA